jgi:uncharacterized membrane protein YgdD (TMEM256/DUF423 family)
MLNARNFLILGAALGALGVALGAFGAHALPGWLEARQLAPAVIETRMQTFEIAARYQMYHALALLITGALMIRRPGGWLAAAGSAFIAGTLIFSGCLYGLALGGPKVLGAIVPIGGVSFIAGWIAMSVGIWTNSR